MRSVLCTKQVPFNTRLALRDSCLLRWPILELWAFLDFYATRTVHGRDLLTITL